MQNFKLILPQHGQGSRGFYYDSTQNIYDTVRIEQATGIIGVTDNEAPCAINIDVKRGGTSYITRLL